MHLPSWLRRLQSHSGDAGASRSLFFNRLWLGIAAMTLVVGVATGRQALSLLGLLVLVSAGAGWLWNRSALNGVEYERSLSADRALPGDIVMLTISVTNRKVLPVPWLNLDDEFPDALDAVDRKTTISGTSGRRTMRLSTSIRPFERVTWRIPLRCLERGVHEFGPAVLRASDPFGFFTNRRTVPGPARLLVYPRTFPLEDLGFPRQQPLGDTRVPRHLVTDPMRVIGIRDYRPEDPFRAIHWKATARHGSLQVRINEPITTLTLTVFANLETFTHYWEGLDVIGSEQVIEVAASLARWSFERKHAVGVYANGVVAGSDQALRLPPGLGSDQLPRVMTGLAAVSPYSTLPFASFLRAESARLPWGSTVVIVSAYLNDVLTAQLAALLAAGRQTIFVPVGECEIPALSGLIVRPVTLPDEPVEAEAAA